MAAIAATLAQYPDEVITSVTHPVSGLPSRAKWLPSVSEVHMACEEAMEPIERARQRQKHLARQMADREAFERDRAHRPSMDELKAKYGDKFGIGVQQAKVATAEAAPNVDQLRHHYQHYDLAFRPKADEGAA